MKSFLSSKVFLQILLAIITLLIGFAEFCSPNTTIFFTGLLDSLFISLLVLSSYFLMRSNVPIIPPFFSFVFYLASVSTLFLGLIIVGYYLSNSQRYIDEHSILALFQTDVGESISYFTTYTPTWLKPIVIILLIFTLVAPAIIFIKINKLKTEGKKIRLSQLLIGLIIGALGLGILPHLGFVKLIRTNFETYYTEVQQFIKLNEQFNSNQTSFTASKEEQGETYVVVVGESLNRNHMQIYGYPRPTTPNLQKLLDNNELIVFDSVYSNHTHTVPTLKMAFTEVSQYNKKDFFAAASIINVLNQAHFETYWISNQVRYGVWDNAIGVIADNSQEKKYHNKYVGARFDNTNHDDVLIKDLEEILAKPSQKNRVIFVHLIGNHSNYWDRYTPDYEKFKGELPSYIFGSANTGKTKNRPYRVNSYDNSVAFNDYVVSSLLNTVRKQNDEVSGFVYFADHSEEVWNGNSHESSKFKFEMAEIPLISWLSDEYKERYPKKSNRIIANKSRLWSNDLMFDFLLGVMGVRTDCYNPEADASNFSFKFPEKGLVLHGDRKYKEDINQKFQIAKNTSEIRLRNEDKRLLPHRMNSLGKIHDISAKNISGLEIDIVFRDKENTNFFEVGHHNTVMTKKSFLQYYTLLPESVNSKIWLDIKNLNNDNHEAILNRVIELDSELNIKDFVILESGWKSSKFKEFANLGFHTSYYLPTELFQIKDANTLLKEAKQIAKQIKLQKVSAVSFDYRVYPWVKKYLEPLINNSIVYHMWDLTLSISNPSFINQLDSKEYYQDERVKTILYKLPSKYEL